MSRPQAAAARRFLATLTWLAGLTLIGSAAHAEITVTDEFQRAAKQLTTIEAGEALMKPLVDAAESAPTAENLTRRAIGWSMAAYSPAGRVAIEHVTDGKKWYESFAAVCLTRARADFARVIAADPKVFEAWKWRGHMLQTSNYHAEAMVDLNEALSLKPGDAQTLAWRAQSNWGLRRQDEALADANESLRLRPDDAETLVTRGLIYYTRGENDAARADADLAAKLMPDWARAHTFRAAVLQRQKDNDGAIAAYTEALRCNPDHADALMNRAQLYERKRRPKAALADYTSVIDHDPKFWIARQRRAALLMKMNRNAEAVEDLDVAIKVLEEVAAHATGPLPKGPESLSTLRTMRATAIAASTKKE